MYAVIKTGGKQYKVSKDDVISIEKLSDDAGKKIKLTDVLIISDKGKPIMVILLSKVRGGSRNCGSCQKC